MPRYTYYCEVCGETQTLFHGVSESPEECTFCSAGPDKLVKKLSKPHFNVPKKEVKSCVGDLVKSSIEEFRQDLKNQKNNLKDKAKEDV